MKTLVAWCVVGLLASALVLSLLDVQNARQGERAWQDSARVRGEQVTIWQAKYATEAVRTAKRDTLWRIAKARVDSIRDTIPLWRHDTTYITEYVTRTDAALQACSELADSCTLFRVAADSTISAVSHERDAYRTLWEKEKPSKWDRVKPWVFLAGGFYVGANLRVP